MYEGLYYKNIIKLNELKKESLILSTQLKTINLEIEMLEQLLRDTEPTDCRGGYCG